jgi:hypothetical protein
MIPINHDRLNELANEHFIAIREQLKADRNIKKLSCWFTRHGSVTLKEAILAPTPLLEQIALEYSKAPINTILKDLYNKKFSKSDNFIGTKKYNAATLVQSLGIKVCPYCNRNYINNVPTNKNIRRTSQLDHFFNKSRYPYLAMSFYNLIPVCPSCNLLKHKYDISASPYDKRIDWDEAVKFNYGITSADYLKEESRVYVKVSYSNDLKENFNILKLDKQYEMHNDLAFELLKKGVMYGPKQLDEIMKNYSGLYKSKEEMLRVIYGNYLDKEELGKRPLSKMTKDIVGRLYF